LEYTTLQDERNITGCQACSKEHKFYNCGRCKDVSEGDKCKVCPDLPESPKAETIPAASVKQDKKEQKVGGIKACDICCIPERAADTAFVPCGHKICCGACAEQVREDYNRCPICSEYITNPAMLKCCGSVFCENCIMKAGICPVSKHKIDTNNIVKIYE